MMNDQATYAHWRNDKIYAGFWIRFAALLLDGLILLPVALLFSYLNSIYRLSLLYSYVPQLLIMLFYHVYLVKRNGATPGKSAVGIMIIKLNGEKVGWEEATYRYVAYIVYSVVTFMIMAASALNISDEQFLIPQSLQRSSLLLSNNPVYYYYLAFWGLWYISETIVLLGSDRKRAIHDFIGYTVVVNKVYYKVIQESKKTEITADF